jgi:hypothetical protein
MMHIPKYSKGTQVRIINPNNTYEFKEKRKELGLWEYSDKYYVSNFQKDIYTVKLDFLHNNKIIYLIKSERECCIFIDEDSIDEYAVIGHQYIGKHDNLNDPDLYDVEEWTPVAGGCYIGTLAIKVSKKEAEVFIQDDKKQAENWRKGTHFFPWRNGIRVVKHVPRKYIVIDHEGHCPSEVYNFTKKDETIAKYKLMHYASKEYDKDEILFTKRDLDNIVKEEVKNILKNISSKLTIKQAELLQKGLDKLNV